MMSYLLQMSEELKDSMYEAIVLAKLLEYEVDCSFDAERNLSNMTLRDYINLISYQCYLHCEKEGVTLMVLISFENNGVKKVALSKNGKILQEETDPFIILNQLKEML